MEDDDVEDVEEEEDAGVEEDDEKDDNVAQDEVENDDAAEDKVEVDDVEDGEDKWEEDNDVEKGEIEDEEEDDAAENDDVEEEDRPQDRDPHFVQACAVDIHLDISQEPFCTKNAGKMPPTKPTRTLREPAQLTCDGHFTRATLCENLAGKCRRPAGEP